MKTYDGTLTVSLPTVRVNSWEYFVVKGFRPRTDMILQVYAEGTSPDESGFRFRTDANGDFWNGDFWSDNGLGPEPYAWGTWCVAPATVIVDLYELAPVRSHWVFQARTQFAIVE